MYVSATPSPTSHLTLFSPQFLTRWAPSSYAVLFSIHRLCAVLNTGQIAAGVIVAWTSTVYKQFELLAGKSAPHDFLQLLIYKATTFSDEIEQIDTVRAYHVSLSPLLIVLMYC